MLKPSFSIALLAGTLVAAVAPAFARHGQEYRVSACDKDRRNTAHMVVTAVEETTNDPAIQAAVQKSFEEVMKKHTAQGHRTGTPSYKRTLNKIFLATTMKLIEETGRARLNLDIDHPRANEGGPVTPGCKQAASSQTAPGLLNNL